MIHVAKAELVSAYKFAFCAAGMALGEAEDAAQIAIWLDICGLDAMSRISRSLSEPGTRRRARPILLAGDDSSSRIDACGASALEVGTAIIDYAIAEHRRRGPAGMTVVNMCDGTFIPGLASVFVARRIDATLQWGARKPFHNLLVVADGVVFGNQTQVETDDSAGLPAEFELRLGHLETTAFGYAPHRVVPQQRNGLRVDELGWNSLQQAAGKMLVPESEVSRVAGAGIGADED